MTTAQGISLAGHEPARASEILTPEALAFVARLQRELDPRRRELLAARRERAARLRAGELPGFLEETRTVRESDWRVPEAPADLRDRRVEITGPVERKMMINALNSGRARLHGRLRGRELADVGERASRARSTCAMP